MARSHGASCKAGVTDEPNSLGERVELEAQRTAAASAHLMRDIAMLRTRVGFIMGIRSCHATEERRRRFYCPCLPMPCEVCTVHGSERAADSFHSARAGAVRGKYLLSECVRASKEKSLASFIRQ